jgi:hypothetical protein
MIGYYEAFVKHSAAGVSIIKRAVEHVLASGYQFDQNEAIDNPSGNFTTPEVRRRTVWSCFILDCYTCWIGHRSQSLRPHELRLQLPSTESTFLCGREIQTRFLREDKQTYEKRIEDTRERKFEVEEGGVSCLTQLVDLYREIFDFSTIQELRCL